MSEEYIYSTFDAGDVATFDNAVYIKQGMTYVKPNKSWKTTDIVNIKGLTFNRDDNNDLNGDVHKEWRPIEIAISNLPQYTSLVWSNPTIMDVDIRRILESIPSLLTKNLRFEVPADGIARIIIYNEMEFDITVNITINDVPIPYFLKGNASMKDANAYKVMAGDVIEIPNRLSRAIILPYEYTAS